MLCGWKSYQLGLEVQSTGMYRKNVKKFKTALYTNSHQQPISEFEVSDTSFNSSHATPKKLKKTAKVWVNENICSICHIEWETEEDISTDSVWINCSK